MAKIECFGPNTLEAISKIFGELTTGYNLTKQFRNVNFPTQDDVERTTKWRRIEKQFTLYQQKFDCANHIIALIEYYINPVNFIGRHDDFIQLRLTLNTILAFDGITINESGKCVVTKKATTLREAMIDTQLFKVKLENLNIHPKIIDFCKPDIIHEDYFNIILESSKSLYDEIRKLTGLTTDSNSLVYEAFNDKSPMLVFSSMKNQSEIDEFTGYRQLLLSIGNLFRNPRSHKPKIYSYDNEDDCLQILHIISFALSKLNKCQIVRRV